MRSKGLTPEKTAAADMVPFMQCMDKEQHGENQKEEDWKEEIQKAQNGNQAVREAVLEKNMGLIYLVLKRFYGRGYEMEDLFQIGAIGLLKAIDRFDTGKEVAFSTYAVPMIIGEIQRFMRDNGMIHFSRQVKDDARKIAYLREKIKKTENAEPTMERLAAETGFSRERILAAFDACAAVESIYRPVASGGMAQGDAPELTLADQLTDDKNTENRLIDRIAVRQMLESLGEKEKMLVHLRYMEGKTQTETAGILRMNQVAVSRLEKKILLQLRTDFGYNKEDGRNPKEL